MMTATSKAILSWTPLALVLVGAVLVVGADRQKIDATAKRVDAVVEKQDGCEGRLDANEGLWWGVTAYDHAGNESVFAWEHARIMYIGYTRTALRRVTDSNGTWEP